MALTRLRPSWLLVGWVLLASGADAGQVGGPADAASSPALAPIDLPLPIMGPPPPVPPAVVSRDAAGRVTVRAVRLDAPLRVDGRLDEGVYETVPAISDFVQTEPREGAPATEKTEIWVFFDNNNVYVTARCWESQPERLVANEMRRDSGALQNDHIGITFDTFYDHRNSNIFNITPVGGRMDGQGTNERNYSGDWNPIWDFGVGRFEGGWTVEVAIPFKSLRYRPGRAQVWGFNVRRRNRWKNEVSHLTPIPASIGMQGTLRVSLAATLVGLEAPEASWNLEIKPYVTANLTTDVNAKPSPLSNEFGRDVGVDVKYGVTRNLTADFTVNTDFAQVEADEQQINLTRFSLFFPEKREFFLENQGTFSFGGASGGGGVRETPVLFYSRRIGLDQGANQSQPVPIVAGGRLTGRVGRFSLGLLDVQSGDVPATGVVGTNFSVVRVKRDILRRSSVGAIFTGRSNLQVNPGTNEAYGVDGLFSFFTNLNINTYWAQTRTNGSPVGARSYRAQLDYDGDRYGAQIERLAVGERFAPGVGFVRRTDMYRNFAQVRFSPRPRSIRSVRRFSWTGSIAQVQNGAGRLETRDWDGTFGIEFQTSDQFTLAYSGNFEYLPRPSNIGGVILPVGDYDFGSVRTGYNFGRQRRVAGNVQLETGTFYDGRRTAVGLSGSRINFSPQLSAEPSYSLNRVTLSTGSFTTHLVGSRVTFTMTPLMFTSTLVQYNSSTRALSANVRLRWEYQPGSELFVVYNEQRDTSLGGFPDLTNRALIVKINRLVRF